MPNIGLVCDFAGLCFNLIPANPLREAGRTFTYNFSTGENKVLSGINAHKDLGSGVWGMVADDTNADTQVDNKDKDDKWVPNEGKGSQMPE
jgi:hypothetical protein